MARLDDLRALREQLLVWIDDAPVDKKAPLVAQYRATLSEIQALEPKEAQGDGIDEIAKRRSARRAGAAKSPSRAKRSS